MCNPYMSATFTNTSMLIDDKSALILEYRLPRRVISKRLTLIGDGELRNDADVVPFL